MCKQSLDELDICQAEKGDLGFYRFSVLAWPGRLLDSTRLVSSKAGGLVIDQ